jgi:hypothetical protein
MIETAGIVPTEMGRNNFSGEIFRAVACLFTLTILNFKEAHHEQVRVEIVSLGLSIGSFILLNSVVWAGSGKFYLRSQGEGMMEHSL